MKHLQSTTKPLIEQRHRATVTSNLAFLSPTLIYDATSVFLIPTRNDVAFPMPGATPDQISVADSIEALGQDPIYGAVVTLDVASARAAFDRLSGDIHAGSSNDRSAGPSPEIPSPGYGQSRAGAAAQ